MTRLDTINERHNDFVSSHPCSPELCDTRIVLDALDWSKADTFRMGHNWEDALTQRDAARADADRLAEALRRRHGYRCNAPEGPCDACEALRQHDTAKEASE